LRQQKQAKRKNFHSLIEKILSGARIKKYVENFSFLPLRRSGGVATPRWVGSAKRTLPARAERGLASEVSVRIFFKIGSNFIQ